MAQDKKPADAKLKKVDELLDSGTTLDDIAKDNPDLASAVEYRRSHERVRAGGAAPVKQRSFSPGMI